MARKRATRTESKKPPAPPAPARPGKIRALLRKLHERHWKDSALQRRKAALAISAGAMGLTTVAVGVSAGTLPPTQAMAAPMPERRQPPVLLHASEELKRSLIEEEGVRDVVYRDVAGYPTVGVGHLLRPEDGLSVGERVSQEQILDFLDADIEGAELAARQLAGSLPLFQHEFDALVDLVFNVGPGNCSEEQSPQLNAAIRAGDYDAIARELSYTHAAGVQAKGLVYRSERRSNIFLNASYRDPRSQA